MLSFTFSLFLFSFLYLFGLVLLLESQMLKVPILPLNIFNIGFLAPYFAFLPSIFQQELFLDNFPAL